MERYCKNCGMVLRQAYGWVCPRCADQLPDSGLGWQAGPVAGLLEMAMQAFMPKVYLGGYITGESYAEATGWRDDMTIRLKPLVALSPMRRKAFLDKEKSLMMDYQQYQLEVKEITRTDLNDIRVADAVFFKIDKDRASLGCMIELGYAHALNKPIVVMMKEGDVHWHGMVRELAWVIVPSLADGVRKIKDILGVE